MGRTKTSALHPNWINLLFEKVLLVQVRLKQELGSAELATCTDSLDPATTSSRFHLHSLCSCDTCRACTADAKKGRKCELALHVPTGTATADASPSATRKVAGRRKPFADLNDDP